MAHITVQVADEAQDTPPVAMKLLFHWAKCAQELVLYGDAKQAIFSFMGADQDIRNNLARMQRELDKALEEEKGQDGKVRNAALRGE